MDEMAKKAYEGSVEITKMATELNAEREKILDTILTADMRVAVPRLTEIKAQLETIRDVQRHHKQRRRDYLDHLKQVVH